MDAVPTVPTGKTPTNIDTAVPTTGQMDAVPTVPTRKTPTNIDNATAALYKPKFQVFLDIISR